MWALGEIGDYSAIPYCKDALGQRSWIPFASKRREELRAAAALALGSIGNDECRDFLRLYSDDRSERVRHACIESLRRIQRRRAIQAVDERRSAAASAEVESPYATPPASSA